MLTTDNSFVMQNREINAAMSSRGLSHLRFLSQLQTGGCGTVFLAMYQPTRSLVAVKVVPFIHHYSEKSFLAEVAITEKLSACPNSISVIDSFTDSSYGYLVMEAHSGDMLEIIPKLNEEKGKAIFKQVCIAVKSCHDQQIAHLDIKPENVLISKTGKAILCDYGAAHQFEAPMQTAVGTIYYSAPETLTSLHYNKASADIFSLGVLLHVLLTNGIPYPGGSEEEVCKNIKIGNLDLSDLSREPISVASKNLIVKMLSTNPNQRPTIDRVISDC